MEWEKRNYLGIEWPTQQRLPNPHREINRDEFMARYTGTHGLDGIHFQSLFIMPDDVAIPSGLRDFYSVNYFWFPNHALVMAHRFEMASEGIFRKHQFVGWKPKHYPKEWHVVPVDVSGNAKEDGTYVKIFRYFVIGCEHPHLHEVGGTAMFDHKYACPDCGYENRTNSS